MASLSSSLATVSPSHLFGVSANKLAESGFCSIVQGVEAKLC